MSDTIVVTGANRGIGLALCRLVHKRGDRAIAVCRSSSPDLEQLGVEVYAGVDVTSDASVAQLVENLRGLSIDVLINNAGILKNQSLGDLEFEGIRQQFEVNSLGPLRVSAALLGQMKKGSKIAIITSRMGSIADNTSGGCYGYRMSKAAVNMAGVSLAHDVAEQGISVAILHPGFVRTEMTNRSGQLDPEQSASMLLERIAQLTPQTSGTFWHANAEVLPW